MAAIVLILVVLIVLGVSAVRGWLPDTRDPEFSLGRVLRGRDEVAPAKPDSAPAPPSAPTAGSAGGDVSRAVPAPPRRAQLASA
jgi:hypothetical protein